MNASPKPLSEKAMLVHLHLSIWSAQRNDKRIAREVAERHRAQERVGRYLKRLLPKRALLPLERHVRRVRRDHRELTLPWSDSEGRLLPSALFPRYSKKMRRHRERFEELVSEFLKLYPEALKDAETTLQDLFRPEDYPCDQSELEGKFSMRLLVRPLPVAEDFRVALHDKQVEKIRCVLRRQLRDSKRRAMGDLATRFFEAVDHLGRVLSDPDARFHKNLLVKLERLVELLPGLNILSDPRLDELGRSVRERLSTLDPKEIRSSAPLRKRSGDEARELASEISGLMAAYTGSPSGSSVCQAA